MKTSYRTHTCGELSMENKNQEVSLCGWVYHRRDHGGLIFIDLRDRYGITQICADPIHCKEAYKVLDSSRSEYVLQIKGRVRPRPSDMENKKLKTGDIEILALEAKILNPSKTLPFEISTDHILNEELRLKYRYLDLRRERLKKNIEMRHKVIKLIRDYMDSRGFLEIETPVLIKGTPEGSREYIVPSRLHLGKFYVLPQSPQQLKQLCMVAGLDRYFQIARCFRDEDQRGDRQPEFTQLDIEMSFVDEEDIIEVNENLMIHLIEKLLPNIKIQTKPFPHFSWHEALSKFGSDKPDIRFGMEIKDVADILSKSSFGIFTEGIKKKDGVIKALKIESGASFSRKEIDELTETAKIHGIKGLAYLILQNNEFKSPVTKFLTEHEINQIKERVNLKNGDIVFFAADEFRKACLSLGAVRLECAKKFKLLDKNIFAFCWIRHFPMFEWSETEKKITASHHPFCNIKEEDIELLDTDPMKTRAKAYDFVLNGVEIGGGSIRIHKQDVQAKIFDILQISKEDAKRRFGHMLEAFEYGAPPHGGIAWGLDRLIMIFQNEPNIREIIAFPKDQNARDLMLDAPSILPKEQIEEMHIKVLETGKVKKK